ncbi:DinB family protein [Gaetbulibacter sp. M235]|uniref:DinB family protein n=1 Tax=Gaetbulibacter sp. M235 TaxID=3126510 RepID=UPI00374F1205
MRKISVLEMFEELNELTQKAIYFGEALKNLNHAQLNYKPEPEVWSVYECLEHLNLYGDHYLKEIENTLKTNKIEKPADYFKGGFLGNYFVKIIRPANGHIKKMKTAKDMNPISGNLNELTLSRFISQQKKLLTLLNNSKDYNLQKIKISTTLSQFINLSLGDTLRFVVYHNERHLVQASEILHKANITVA